MPVRFGDCAFDPDARELWRGTERVALSPKAFQLLALLVAHRPRPLSHASLRDALWPEANVGYTSLARVVTEVRKALGGDKGAGAFVRTVPRFGYAFAGSGPDAAATEGLVLVGDDREYVLGEGEMLVGRGPGCAVRLSASGVSRVHAALRVREGQVVIEDRGSKNGTWVNGRRIEAPLALDDGDEVIIGNHRLLLRSAASMETTRTAALPD
jgi:DNA-binding winged helix-turn-helix (wHTH) protein